VLVRKDPEFRPLSEPARTRLTAGASNGSTDSAQRTVQVQWQELGLAGDVSYKLDAGDPYDWEAICGKPVSDDRVVHEVHGTD
jgi:hypothetical protein